MPSRSRVVLGHLHSPALPDHGDLHLAGIFETILDLAGDLVCEQRSLVVTDITGADDDPDLAAGLQGVHLLDAGLGRCQLFESFESLDVLLEALAASARP